GVLTYLPDGSVNLVSVPAVVNWTHYQLQARGYDLEIVRDDNSNRRKGPPRVFRYEIQGPNALEIVQRAAGEQLPKVKFFHTTELRIAGGEQTAIRHGMAGQ